MSWFPAAGAVIGAVLGVVWWGTSRLWPPLVAAVLVVAVDLAITGMLHFDGLVDSADGLLGHLPRERRLAVMSEPTVGAFGVAAAAMVLLLRVTALASLLPDVGLIAGLWCASRTVMAVAARTVPYARAHGLASAFGGSGWRLPATYGAVTAVLLATIGEGVTGAVSVLVAVIAGSAVVLAARSRVGGYTGDVLGAAGVIAETAGIVVVAARW